MKVPLLQALRLTPQLQARHHRTKRQSHGIGAMAIGACFGPIGMIAGGQIASMFQTQDTVGSSDSTSTSESRSHSTNQSTLLQRQRLTHAARPTPKAQQTHGSTQQVGLRRQTKAF